MPTILYEDYEKLIKQIVYRFWENNKSIDWQDLFSEANYSFCLALKSFNSDRAMFSTYLYQKLKYRLNNFCSNEYKKREQEFINQDIPTDKYSPEHFTILKSMINSLSEEAQTIIKIALKYLSFNNRYIRKRKKIITLSYIRKEAAKKGMKQVLIEKSIKEIKNQLSAL